MAVTVTTVLRATAATIAIITITATIATIAITATTLQRLSLDEICLMESARSNLLDRIQTGPILLLKVQPCCVCIPRHRWR